MSSAENEEWVHINGRRQLVEYLGTLVVMEICQIQLISN